MPSAPATPPSGSGCHGETLLDRYGIVTREAVEADGGPVTWSEVLDTLKRMEWKGHVRQGYFIGGLTGAQFARPDAVERLRQARERADGPMRILAATDPANPYGAILPWPEESRLSRLPSTYVVLASGQPVLAAESYGKRLTPLVPLSGERLLQALATLPDLLKGPAPVRALRRIEVLEWGEESVQQSPAAEALAAVGFERAPRKLVYYP